MGFFFSKPELKDNEVEFMGMRFACTEDYFIKTYRETGDIVFLPLYLFTWIEVSLLSLVRWAWGPFDKASLAL
mgnify:CR=1 FL=1